MVGQETAKLAHGDCPIAMQAAAPLIVGQGIPPGLFRGRDLVPVFLGERCWRYAHLACRDRSLPGGMVIRIVALALRVNLGSVRIEARSVRLLTAPSLELLGLVDANSEPISDELERRPS